MFFYPPSGHLTVCYGKWPVYSWFTEKKKHGNFPVRKLWLYHRRVEFPGDICRSHHHFLHPTGTREQVTSHSIILVGGVITILKNMSSSMGRTIPYMNWKKEKTFMFQTTNQVLSPFTVGHSLYGSLPHFSSFNLPISVGYLTPRTSLGTWLNCI